MRPYLLAFLATIMAMTGCSSSGSDDGSGSDDASAVTVDSLRASSSAAMAAIESVAFTVSRSGAEVSIDEAGLVVFESADARFAAPTSADAVVAVLLLGNRIELGAVAIDGTLYLTDPLTGAWQDATGTIAFDPAKIFSPTEGVASVLGDGLTGAVLESDVADATGLLYLSGVVNAADVDTLTSGLVSQEATARFAIDADTSLVDRIDFDTPIDDGVATWLVELADYGADVTIVAPDLD